MPSKPDARISRKHQDSFGQPQDVWIRTQFQYLLGWKSYCRSVAENKGWQYNCHPNVSGFETTLLPDVWRIIFPGIIARKTKTTKITRFAPNMGAKNRNESAYVRYIRKLVLYRCPRKSEEKEMERILI